MVVVRVSAYVYPSSMIQVYIYTTCINHVLVESQGQKGMENIFVLSYIS